MSWSWGVCDLHHILPAAPPVLSNPSCRLSGKEKATVWSSLTKCSREFLLYHLSGSFSIPPRRHSLSHPQEPLCATSNKAISGGFQRKDNPGWSGGFKWWRQTGLLHLVGQNVHCQGDKYVP